MKTKTILVVIAVLMAITTSFYIGGIKPRRNNNQLSLALYNAQNTVKKYEIDIQKEKRYVSEQQAIIVDNWKSIKQLEEEKERLKELNIKNVKVIGSLTSQVNVLNKKLSIVTPDTIKLINTVYEPIDDCLPVPMELQFRDQYSWAIVRLEKDDQNIDFGITELNFNVVVGQRGGLLRQNTNIVSVDTPNPYIDISNINFIVVEKKVKLHQRKLLWFLGGIGLGVLVF